MWLCERNIFLFYILTIQFVSLGLSVQQHFIYNSTLSHCHFSFVQKLQLLFFFGIASTAYGSPFLLWWRILLYELTCSGSFLTASLVQKLAPKVPAHSLFQCLSMDSCSLCFPPYRSAGKQHTAQLLWCTSVTCIASDAKDAKVWNPVWVARAYRLRHICRNLIGIVQINLVTVNMP